MLKYKKLVVGLIFSWILTGAILAIMALMFIKTGLPAESVSSVLTASAGVIAVFISAFFTAKNAGERGLVHGVVLAIAYLIVFASASWMMSNGINGTLLLVRALAYLIAGTLGGIIGVGEKTKVKF